MFLVIRICQMDVEEGNLVPQTTASQKKQQQQNDKKLQPLNYLIVIRETEEIISCVLLW